MGSCAAGRRCDDSVVSSLAGRPVPGLTRAMTIRPAGRARRNGMALDGSRLDCVENKPGVGRDGRAAMLASFVDAERILQGCLSGTTMGCPITTAGHASPQRWHMPLPASPLESRFPGLGATLRPHRRCVNHLAGRETIARAARGRQRSVCPYVVPERPRPSRRFRSDRGLRRSHLHV